MRISDWSSDVCSSDLIGAEVPPRRRRVGPVDKQVELAVLQPVQAKIFERTAAGGQDPASLLGAGVANLEQHGGLRSRRPEMDRRSLDPRSEEHTSELQSLMRSSYAVFCLKNKKWTMSTNGITPCPYILH